MKTELEFKFHKGQEFSKKDDSHLHCIIQSYVDGELAYLVTYTCSGHWKKVTEADLVELYAPSNNNEKRSALAHLDEKSESHENDSDENGTPMSPAE